MADVVMVMYLGKVAEIGTATAIFERPAHPYTAALLDSMPAMDPDQRTEEAPLYGDPPNPINPPPGRSEEHTSELQSLMRISYAVFCLKKKITHITTHNSLQYTYNIRRPQQYIL